MTRQNRCALCLCAFLLLFAGLSMRAQSAGECTPTGNDATHSESRDNFLKAIDADAWTIIPAMMEL